MSPAILDRTNKRSPFGFSLSATTDKNDDYLLEKGSHIFVSDRVSEPIALRIIDIS